MKTKLIGSSKSLGTSLRAQRLITIFLSGITKTIVLSFFIIIGISYPDTYIASVNKVYITDYFKGYAGSDSSKKADENRPAKEHVSINSSKIVYSVEIISLSGYLPPNAVFFKKCGRAAEHVINNQHVYTIGEYQTAEEAQKMANNLRVMGYKDAFTVAFVNKNRVMISEIDTGLCNK